MNCAELTKVEIPDSVEIIADNAFDGCDDLLFTAQGIAMLYRMH